MKRLLYLGLLVLVLTAQKTGPAILCATCTNLEYETITSSATPTPIMTHGTKIYTITGLATNAVFGAPSGTTPHDGDMIVVRLIDDGMGPYSIGYNAAYRASSDLALPITTTTDKEMYLMFFYNSRASTWDAMSYLDNFPR